MRVIDYGLRARSQSSNPSWLGPVDEWSEITGSALNVSGVGWSGTSPGGTGTYLQIVSAWGGGILNTTGIWRAGAFVSGIFLVIFGGGHGDYGGNELYAFGPLDSDTPTWSRITDPTIPAPDDVARDGSGNPVSRHSYDTLVYLPTANKMLCIGAPGYFHTGFKFNAGDLFDFAVNPAEDQPWSSVDTGFPAYGGGGTGTINLISGYDSVNGRAWGLGKGNAQRIGYYSVSGGAWTDFAIDNPGMSGDSKAGLSSSLQIMVSTDASGAPIAVDLRSTPARYTPTVTGTGPGVGELSFEWDESGGRFVCWGLSGKTVYYLTPGADPYSGGDSWAWSSVSPSAGATPGSPQANGTYGRLRLIEAGGWRGLVLMSSATANIQVFRMS